METNSIPAVIQAMIAQLGGRKIFAMAFTGSVYGCEAARPAGTGVASLTLKIAPALVRSVKGKATHVVVQLEADDTYTVKSIRVRGADFRAVDELALVYGDQLRSVVESITGLTLTLGTFGARA